MQMIGLSYGKWLFFVHIEMRDNSEELQRNVYVNKQQELILFFRWLDQDTSSNIQSLYHDGNISQELAQDDGAIDDVEMWESISQVTLTPSYA